MSFIDTFLNRITMYRLVLYELLALLFVAGVVSAFGWLPFSVLHLAWSVALIALGAFVFNMVFAYAFDAPTNPESTYITALILALIISPPASFTDQAFLTLAFWATGWAIASKYIFAIRDKHLFNPAAFGVAATALILGQSASWWIGTSTMLPFVLIGGFLVVRKIKRFDLVSAFLVTAGSGIVFSALVHGIGLFQGLTNAVVLVPTIFFASVMLTEPLTTPPTRALRILYGVFVGLLFYPDLHVGGTYLTPELALLAGNLLSYAMSPKTKLVLTLTNRIRLSPSMYEFVFAPNRPLAFQSGQYLEWTLPHEAYDSRGVRRYFTIASAPSDSAVRLGVKFYDPASSFKKTLGSLARGDQLIASQLAGDFTLPRDKHRKLVFIAGGIGITPFVSMIRHMLNENEARDIVLLYANNTTAEVAYRELLERATALGVRTVHAISKDPTTATRISRIDAAAIRTAVPDFLDRTFYISGPHGLVAGMHTTLRDLDVPASRIKTDYFPGFA
ncbi:MAG: hypothetical protein B7X04_03170 [Parcubacteria group bacterium 21-54-25]|nr:MAG: hypothetical protein B7X04_03170 [Parcubacteria group bacterium 21-54-25]HQU07990.1 hypothetical protein [Candidatus Paceibacterota bacterium]